MVLEFGTFIIAAAFANVFVLVFADHFCLISSGQLVAKSPQRPPSRFVDDQCHVVSQKPVHTAHTHTEEKWRKWSANRMETITVIWTIEKVN